MSRPLRIEFPGATYHVESKAGFGNEVFLNEDDKKSFLNVLTNVVARFGWLVHSYSIMNESYRIILEVPNFPSIFVQSKGKRFYFACWRRPTF